MQHQNQNATDAPGSAFSWNMQKSPKFYSESTTDPTKISRSRHVIHLWIKHVMSSAIPTIFAWEFLGEMTTACTNLNAVFFAKSTSRSIVQRVFNLLAIIDAFTFAISCGFLTLGMFWWQHSLGTTLGLFWLQPEFGIAKVSQWREFLATRVAPPALLRIHMGVKP